MEPEKRKLVDMSNIVHNALKTLKMGQIGTVACSKQFSADELREYVTAYAFHKNKWFNVKHDAVSNVLFCERTTPPPFEKPESEADEEEL